MLCIVQTLYQKSLPKATGNPRWDAHLPKHSHNSLSTSADMPDCIPRQRDGPLPRALSQCSLEAIWGMISLCEQRCIRRESDHGGQCQRGPFPHRDHAHGRAVVCGIPLKLLACRSTPGGARGAD